MFHILDAQNKIQELYKHNVIDAKAPRLDAINGNKEQLVLSFFAPSGRSIMDFKSLTEIMFVLNKVFETHYFIKGFTVGRNMCSIVFGPR